MKNLLQLRILFCQTFYSLYLGLNYSAFNYSAFYNYIPVGILASQC